MKNIGHQAPKGWRINVFNSIHLDTHYMDNWYYCHSHNFMFERKDEERKLYWGLPCVYTDKRFQYDSEYLYDRRWDEISLKACIRRVNKCRNIPKGTNVYFGKSWYYAGKKINNGFLYRVRKENLFHPQYVINKKKFFDNPIDTKLNKFVSTLRELGFLVSVHNQDLSVGGEVAIAYGYGKKIGISSDNNSLFGYQQGIDNILWDNFGEFDKWSRCNEISKSTPEDEIIKILTDDQN